MHKLRSEIVILFHEINKIWENTPKATQRLHFWQTTNLQHRFTSTFSNTFSMYTYLLQCKNRKNTVQIRVHILKIQKNYYKVQ